MFQHIQKIMHTKYGEIIISILLGLGLASLFRKACNGVNCLNFIAPKVSEVESEVYKHGNDCYKFKAKTVKCDESKKHISFA